MDAYKASPETSIAVENVRVTFGRDHPVLDIPELSIKKGERVAVLGPSGAGKTTLFRLINGYVPLDAGTVTVMGSSITRQHGLPREVRGEIGFVFQSFNLVERATVYDNVLWGSLGRTSRLLSLLGWFPRSDRQKAQKAIEEVSLHRKEFQRADRLSGGEQQRVGVARVLAQEASIVLADEPVSNLDPRLTEEIVGLIVDVCERRGLTLLLSLHRPDIARTFTERTIALREGRIAFDGSSADLDDRTLKAIYSQYETVGTAEKVSAV